MPQEILRQDSFTSGELDPLIAGRRDVKDYYKGLAVAENLRPFPQGAIERRPGLVFVDRIRWPLLAVPIPGDAVITAPNGGDTTKIAAAGDGALLTTTDMGVTDPYVIATIDFGAPVTVGLVDLVDFAVVASGGGGGTGDPPPPGGWNPYGGGGGLGGEGGGREAF